MCGLRTICHGSTQTPGLRLPFMFEMLLCPHHVLNEIAALENLIQRFRLPHNFVRQISCARDITRLECPA